MTTQTQMNTLLMLSNESTVDLYLLAESQELFDLIKKDTPYTELLAWVNENFQFSESEQKTLRHGNKMSVYRVIVYVSSESEIQSPKDFIKLLSNKLDKCLRDTLRQ